MKDLIDGRDGKDLSRIHWAFLAAELRALPKVTDEVQDIIDLVVCGIDKLALGEKWDTAAYVARAAADAAARAAIKRQRDTVLALISDAA